MLKRWPSIVLFAASVLLGAAGCGREPVVQPERGVADGAPPQRIVCGSPAVTEIVFALGCADRVVGVSDYCTHPRAARDKPTVGGWINPNRERLLRLDPDIIVTQGDHETLSAFAEDVGIRCHAVTLDSLDDVFSAVTSIAAVLGVAPRGDALAASMCDDIDAVADGISAARPVSVLLVFGRVPGALAGLTTVGPGTFLDDLLRRLQATNVFSDVKGMYPQVSKEALLMRRPEVILEVNVDLAEDQIPRLREDWQALVSIPAVAAGRIRFLRDAYLLVPGPRIGRTAARLAEAIHGVRDSE